MSFERLNKSSDRAITVTVGNYKGGAGKTTNTVLISYMLAKRGIRSLVLDLDPQSNATKSLMLTKSINEPDGVITIEKTIMKGIQEGSFKGLEVKIMENLFLLPSFIDFEDFPKHLYQNTLTEEEEDFFINNLLEPLKEDYDVILIDVPPMSKEVTRNAVVSSDYVLISLQTHERSLTGAESYIQELDKLNRRYNLGLTVVGILPVLQKNGGTVDEYIMETAKNSFGSDNMFKNIVPQMERIKRFDINGITEKDRHDEKVISKYKDVTDEFIERLNFYEENKDGEY
ncbi:ATPase (plasmid) [Virgibacillus halodenitrificans]|uniref:ATPase n=1 Tax=Virgibacillus halodenitrificans TaxID=1482 RepID=A0AAC9NN88_VIRHA|nr:ParA family protein [Virgibacillus halodenitrificans]APC50364.1 ATPase [Virgibacillus halodenitrificans]AVD54451.1 ParA family protein [Priestia filamentosa]